MPSNAAVLDDLERIGAIEEARVNDTDTPGEYAAKVIGDQFETNWFDLCAWDYRIRSIHGLDDAGFLLRLDLVVDRDEFVFST